MGAVLNAGDDPGRSCGGRGERKLNELQQRRRGLARIWIQGAETSREPWESAGVTRASWTHALRAAAINFLHVSERLSRQRGAVEVAEWSEDAGAEYDHVRAGDPVAVERWLRSERETDPEVDSAPH